MKIQKNELVIPDNVEVVFEHYCVDCDKSEPVIIDSEISEGDKIWTVHRVTCNNTQICQKVRTIAATEKAKGYPFV
jgi:hypothetical protein